MIAACAVLLVGCSSEEPKSAAPSPARVAAALADAPPPLARLYDQGNELLEGGVAAYAERLRDLRGYPVVVNKWASWCDACRSEFPMFQRQTLKRGTEVAFLGVNSSDNDDNAREFLGKFPLAFPSYRDPDLKIATAIKAVQGFPTTVFYDKAGEVVYIHVGAYTSEAKLAEDIGRYALGRG